MPCPPTTTPCRAVLDVPVERLGRAWGAVTHLNEVADTPALRAAFNQGLPRVTDFHTRLGADERLYRKYRQIAASPSAQDLCAAKRQALQHSLRDFVLGGAELQGADRQRFAQIQERAAELRQRYSENVLDATDRYAYFATRTEMAGVPEDVAAAAQAAAVDEHGHDERRFKLTLHEPCYLPVMEYAHDRDLARDAVPRPCHARQRAGRPGARQHRADARVARAAPGRGAPARLPVLRRAVAGAEDGGLGRAGAWLPVRPGAARPALRRTRPGRTARVRRARAGTARPAALGPALRQRAAEAGALRVQQHRAEAVLHRGAGAGRPVPHRGDAVRDRHPGRHRAGVARQRALLQHSRARAR